MAPQLSRDKKERRIAQLMEMGVTRAAAKAALCAKGWQTDEAALVVFDDRYADADDIPSSDDDNEGDESMTTSEITRSAMDKGKGRAREVTKLPTPDEDDVGNEDYGDGQDDDFNEDDIQHEEVDEDAFDDGSDNDSVDYGDGDAYGFLDIAKDREVEIKEVEEPIRTFIIKKTARGDRPGSTPSGADEVVAEVFGLQRWLSGCPEGNEQQQLFPLYTGLAGQDLLPPTCPHKCGAHIEHRESDFFAVPDSFTTYIDRLRKICQVPCSGCGKGICLACNEPHEIETAAATASTPATSQDYTEAPPNLLHCPNLQAVIIGVGLHMAGKLWEDAESLAKDLDGAQGGKSKKRKAATVSVVNAGYDADGYPTDGRRSYFNAGTGYGGGLNDNSGLKMAAKAQQAKDLQLAKLMALVRVYLPNRDRPGPFQNSDHMPAGQTLAHLRRRFNPIASSLLSAESLSDMSERKELYREFMSWLEVMSAHENLAGLMGQPIMRASKITYPALSSSETSGRQEKIIVFQSSPGPRELLERILSQVHIAKKVAQAAKTQEEKQKQQQIDALMMQGIKIDEQALKLEREALDTYASEEATRMNDFCETIEKAVARVDKALKQSKRGEAVLRSMQSSSSSAFTSAAGAQAGATSTSSSSGSKPGVSALASLSDEELKIKYTEWARQHNYQFHDWTFKTTETAEGSLAPAYRHSYSAEAVAVTSHGKRNIALMKEHASLSSSLPAGWNSSIFLLVDEDRPDIIKALMIGPDDTPYENGCFLFDILLGSNYNQCPPTVKSMTTKGGAYRLNPNLYANGKVCLSLLGTWSGPGWEAGKSTLLQVLVSIQSMILWAEPITNEPSFEREHKSPRSRAYNANVRRMVARIAMLEYLKNPPDGFEDIVRTHFKLKARSLRVQLDKWLEEDDGAQLFGDSMSAIHGSRASSSTSAAVAAAAAATAAASTTTAAATPVSGAASSTKADAKSSVTSVLAQDVAQIKQLLTQLELEGP